MITLNSWGTSSFAIHSHGVSSELRAELQSDLEAAISSLIAAREEEILGFMDLPEIDIQGLKGWALEKGKGIQDVIVVGIGGSTLGALAVLATEPSRPDFPQLHFSENMDPDHFNQLLDRVTLDKTLVVVISKSGTTIETMSKFAILWAKLLEIHKEDAAKYVIAITDPEAGSLRAMVEKYGFDSFAVPGNVGGRFSVLSHVGLVPLALQGYPIEALLAGAAKTRDLGLNDDCTFMEEGREIRYKNPVVQAAADHYLLAQRGISQTVLFTYCDSLYPLTDWFCQLWGESLGKAYTRDGKRLNCGLTPIRALGVIDQHSQLQLYVEGPLDKHVIFLELKNFASKAEVPKVDDFPESLQHLVHKDLGEIMRAELEGTQAALVKAQRPTSRITIDRITPEAVGGFIMFWELVTAVMGELFDINAFDQPGVELGKKISHGLLGRADFEKYVETQEENGAVTSYIQH